jgi:hypothetical protein
MKEYPVSIKKCKYWFHILNYILFDDSLQLNFEFVIKNYDNTKDLAMCYIYETQVYEIRMNHVYPNKIIFLNTLAHEMVHIYQLQNNQSFSHGPSFFSWKRNSPKMGLNWGIAPILEPCRITKRLKSSNISLDLHQHSAILEHVHKQFFTQTEGGGHLDYE